ncbi:Nicastrin [Corchorus olitorius]|uniref:Nicastrin n=1 Tax=Corchorus olitorius TaxID=93759 RepID=A0A1R3FUC8_9ROSI|nr:Nicastrin [Corchorus olitorius]
MNSMESVPDLQKSMYMVVDGYPCVRLINISGEIGCSNPGRDKVVAPIVEYKNTKELTQPSAIFLSMDDVEGFFSRISKDSVFASNVGGVLVKSEDGIVNKLKGFSPAQKFPQAQFAPYANTTYEWNPIGSGIMWKSYNFPVFLLSESSTSTLQEIATKTDKTDKAYITNVAEFDLVMQTTKVGTHDSESCLREETCLPLGGYRQCHFSFLVHLRHKSVGLVVLVTIVNPWQGSVWSALPPINSSSSNQSKPIILAVASMDAASFFRDKSLGAESPISGVISLLAAVDALSHMDGLEDLTKQLVFLVFTGEAWGYLGSRRFLLELDQQSDAVYGLNSTLIELVMEIGSTGRSLSQGNKTFFAHTEFGVAFCLPVVFETDTKDMVSSGANEAFDALKLAQESLKSEGVTIAAASSSNPGIPPSSLMTFLRKNSSTSGIVLEDFDTIFSNKFYQSHLDDTSNINSSSIVAAASLVARTLYVLASNSKDLTSSSLESINVNTTLVEELISCMLDCNPGLSCELVESYISSKDTCPSHYVGVVLGEPSSTPYPDQVDDISRFLWNFLADRTSIPKGNTTVCSQDCGKKGGVCIRAETDQKGVCVISTTRYVPAYSTRLKFDSGTWIVLPPNSSDPMGVLDPVWTESNWNTIGLRVYTVQDAAYDRLVLLSGITVTAFAYFAIVLTRAYVTKALKQD